MATDCCLCARGRGDFCGPCAARVEAEIAITVSCFTALDLIRYLHDQQRDDRDQRGEH